MFRPQIQKTYVLVLLASLCLFCVYIASTNFVEINSEKDISEDYKNIAAHKMQDFLSVLKNSRPDLDSSYIINDYIDPNITGLIFEQIIDPSSIKNLKEIRGMGYSKLLKEIKKDLGFEINFDKSIITFKDSSAYNLGSSTYTISKDGLSGTFLDSLVFYDFMTGEGSYHQSRPFSNLILQHY